MESRFVSSDSWRGPLTLPRFARSTSPRTRGEVIPSRRRCVNTRGKFQGTESLQEPPPRKRERERAHALSPRDGAGGGRRRPCGLWLLLRLLLWLLLRLVRPRRGRTGRRWRRCLGDRSGLRLGGGLDGMGLGLRFRLGLCRLRLFRQHRRRRGLHHRLAVALHHLRRYARRYARYALREYRLALARELGLVVQ